MSVVWKFPLLICEEQKVVMPAGAQLLHVGEQDGALTLWARVIPTGQAEVARTIVIRGTGQPIQALPYVGTAITLNGVLVWHVFDGGET